MQQFEATAAARGDHPAMKVKRDGVWETTSWREYRDLVLQVGRGFLALGLEPGDGVVIMGYNRPEWFISNLAAIAVGGLPAGIYTSCTAEQCRYITDHCEARIAVLENTEYLDRFREIRSSLPRLEAIVLMDGQSTEDGVYTWDELLDRAGRVSEERLRERVDAQEPGDLCSLIYTSGTTGPPKAVMLCHRNILWVAKKVQESFEIGQGDYIISYLPLSHIAEQVVSFYCPISAGACSWFAESLEQLGDNLREVRPHFFFAVPRVWEKIQAKIEAAGAQAPPLKRRIAAWARRVGAKARHAEQSGGRPPLLYPLAERLVFSKVRARLGLDRARFCATSAAPISLHTLEFFGSLGITILEVYGMSECTGPTTFSYPDRYRFGAAGLAITGSELRVADDGEVLMRGPHVFLGYYKDEEATVETLDEHGWIHSGDIGELDAEGFLSITDRKKELLITSGGKNVAPQPIEGAIKAIPGVALGVVIGDRRNYLTALLTLDPETVAGRAEMAGSPARDTAAAAACPIFRQFLESQIEVVNSNLARYETIKRFAVLPGQFSIEGDELTPTMKLKRRVVAEKYAAEIEQLYA